MRLWYRITRSDASSPDTHEGPEILDVGCLPVSPDLSAGFPPSTSWCKLHSDQVGFASDPSKIDVSPLFHSVVEISVPRSSLLDYGVKVYPTFHRIGLLRLWCGQGVLRDVVREGRGFP